MTRRPPEFAPTSRRAIVVPSDLGFGMARVYQAFRGGDAGAVRVFTDLEAAKEWLRHPSPTLAGKCLCGSVRYAVKDEFLYALNCHCSNCRRATGAAFKPFAGIERAKLSIVEGESSLLVFGGEKAHDVRCGKCGSLLYSVVREGAFVHVTMGTLVDAPGIRPTAHIFVGSKAPWFTITDELPRHEEFP